MPLDKIRRNDASYNAGFLVSKIYTDQEQALLDSGLVKKIPIYDRVLNQKIEARSRNLRSRLNSLKRLIIARNTTAKRRRESPKTIG